MGRSMTVIDMCGAREVQTYPSFSPPGLAKAAGTVKA